MSVVVTDANGVKQTVNTLPTPGRAAATGALPIVLSNEDLAAINAITAALAPLSTDAKLEAVRALLAGTLAVSASTLPLPTGAATSAKQDTQTSAINASAPADAFAAVTPSDSVALATVPKALFVGSGGDLTVKGSDGVAATFKAQTGQIIPIRARYVMATGTTAAFIVAIS
jgi:hypothetical protein